MNVKPSVWFTGLLNLPFYIFQEKPGDKTEWDDTKDTKHNIALSLNILMAVISKSHND